MTCVWYVSKYVTLPQSGDPLGRGYALMREIAQQGHDSVIVMSDSMGKLNAPKAELAYSIESVDGMTLAWVRTIKYTSSKSLRRIASWLDFERALLRLPTSQLPAPDVVVVSCPSLLTILNGFRLRRKLRCRLVFEVRDIWPLTITEEGGYSERNLIVRALAAIEKAAYERSDVIVGTMPNLGLHVENVTGVAKPTYCVPMGIDSAAYRESAKLPQVYVEKHIPKDQFTVVYAGSIGIANALDPLFACAESMRDVAGVHFLVVGEGELLEQYERDYGHLPNVTFAPRVPKGQVHDLLTRCDLLYLSVHKSRVWDYGLSHNKLIDYMASGRPIVASYSGRPSMINEADCGTFVPAGDPAALQAEVERYRAMSPADRAEVGARGRDWLLANRDYRRLASEYLDILAFGDSQGRAPTETTDPVLSRVDGESRPDRSAVRDKFADVE